MAEEQKKTVSFQLTLPTKAVELLDQLCEHGLYGTKRAEVARQLILDKLKELNPPKL